MVAHVKSKPVPEFHLLRRSEVFSCLSVTDSRSVGLPLVMYHRSVGGEDYLWGNDYNSKAGNLAFIGCRRSARK